MRSAGGSPVVAGGELEEPLVDAVDSATILVSTSIENVVARADWWQVGGLEVVSGGSRVEVEVGNGRRDDDAWFRPDGGYYRNDVNSPGVKERKQPGRCSVEFSRFRFRRRSYWKLVDRGGGGWGGRMEGGA